MDSLISAAACHQSQIVENNMVCLIHIFLLKYLINDLDARGSILNVPSIGGYPMLFPFFQFDSFVIISAPLCHQTANVYTHTSLLLRRLSQSKR